MFISNGGPERVGTLMRSEAAKISIEREVLALGQGGKHYQISH